MADCYTTYDGLKRKLGVQNNIALEVAFNEITSTNGQEPYTKYCN